VFARPIVSSAATHRNNKKVMYNTQQKPMAFKKNVNGVVLITTNHGATF
jgi:hypothetical protein